MTTVSFGNFTFSTTPIEGVVVIDTRCFSDGRGAFLETYKEPDFHAAGITDTFVQENSSVSVHGVLRGVHFQKLHPQSKLVRVQQGEAFDVAVDLRPQSPTFGQWFGTVLSGDNHRQLYLPHGCGHGILMLSERVTFSYLSDDVYHPEDEGAIAWDDETVGIDWPLPHDEVVTSKADAARPSLAEAFPGSFA